MKQFSFEETVAFFRELGIYPKIRNGYYYPASEQASSVLDVLRLEAAYWDVELKVSCHISGLRKENGVFVITTDQGTFSAVTVVFAPGLLASPKTGSDGSAFPLIQQFGHHMIPIVPALVALQGKQPFLKALAGIRTEAEVKLYIDGECLAKEHGELQLTEFGISGIPVFQISRFATKALLEQKEVYALLDFMPAIHGKELNELLEARFYAYAHGKTASEALIGFCNKKLADVLLKESGIDLHMPAERISARQQKQLAAKIKNLRVNIIGSKSFEQAQVCAGGVDTQEVDSSTLMSKLVRGIFFAGEVLDIDGTCGGYNLQWAWSSGAAAGRHAAEYAIEMRNR